MAEDLAELTDKVWRGQISPDQVHPGAHMGELFEVTDAVAFIPSFANVSVFKTSEGLVLIDAGSPILARMVLDQIRGWSDDRVHTIIYSHGHLDHVGAAVYDDDAEQRGVAKPRVMAHAGVPRRFDRYRMTAGYNTVINRRQFSIEAFEWPTDYRYPDETYHRSTNLEVGDTRFELHHGKGETDDHTWTWVPEHGVLCCGDFFIWTSPNAGNPQKVQRYPRDWALALRQMAELRPNLLLPGHGLPLIGADRVVEAFTNTADFLDSIHDQTVALMNEGRRLSEIIHSVEVPEHFRDKVYLQPTYDEPEFIIRNVWRLYGGWYDGNPANLKPAPEPAVAAELAELAGGASRMAERALELVANGDLRLAGHLAELAALAAPDDLKVHAARDEVFSARAAAESSTMARGVFSWAARESRRRAE